MFGKKVSIHFALGVFALVSASHAGVLNAPRTVDGAPVSPANYSLIDPHSTQAATDNSAAHPRGTDIPSAPLPPALWPGLGLLVIIGGAKVALRSRRGIVRL